MPSTISDCYVNPCSLHGTSSSASNTCYKDMAVPSSSPPSDPNRDASATTMHSSYDSNEPKDYGSARAYVEEVRKWYNYTRFWMVSQHQSQMQCQMYQQQQQYYQNAAVIANNAAMGHNQAGVHPRPPLIGLNVLLGRNLPNLPRVFRFAAQNGLAQGSPQTFVYSQHTIPSFARRIAAELIDCVILFFLKLMVVYLAVEFQIM